MSNLKVSNINNASATNGGISIDSSGVVSGGLPSPHRNLLYNGAMQVHQRGTSVTGHTGGGGYLTADRWSFAVANQGTWTVSIENDAPTGSGFAKSYKALCTTGDATTNSTDLIILQQMLEGQDLQRIKKGTSDAEQLTFSFWVKTNVSGTQIVNLIDNDNVRQVSASVSLDGSGTWQKKVVTFPADTTGAFDNDNALSMRVRWWLAAGSSYSTGTLPTTWGSIGTDSAVGQTNFAAATNNYWQITGVQLEVGDTATDFEHKPYGVELAECQRYYWRIADTGSNQMVGTGFYYASSYLMFGVYYPTKMRVIPALEATSGTNVYGVWTTTSQSLNSLTLGGQTTERIAWLKNNTEASGSAGAGALLYTKTSATYVALTAEL